MESGRIIVKKVTKADPAQLFELYRSEGWWSCFSGEKKQCFRQVLRTVKGSYSFFCAFDGPRIVGTVRSVSDGVTFAYILDFAVLREYRGRGIARELFKAIVADLKRKGIEYIDVIASGKLFPMFGKAGFSGYKGFTPMFFALKKTARQK